MNTWPILICGISGFVIAWSLIPLIIKRHLAGQVVQNRMFHQTHSVPVPRFGGVALAVAFAVVCLLAWSFVGFDSQAFRNNWLIVAGSMAVFALGLWDDIKPLGAKVKLAGQILISVLVYLGGLRIDSLSVPFSAVNYDMGMLGFFATVFWLVALTNLINLIDGMDGLAGGISLMLMVLLIYVGWTSLSFTLLLAVGMAAALLAFLHFNFPPARIYLGDGGAYFLGFLIGAMTMASSQKGTIAAALVAPAFALALPIADVSLAILRRGLKGLPIFRPDKKHIHHRLLELGFSRRRAVLILYSLSLIFLAMALAVFWSQGRLIPILFGCLFLTLMISIRSFGFINNWFEVGKVVENSLRLRKETRYALTLSRWLELEAERCGSLRELWESYLFMINRLGFLEVKLELTDGYTTWRRDNVVPSGEAVLRNRHEMAFANVVAIEFKGKLGEQTSPKLLEILTELSAEAWMKALQRWQAVNSQAVYLEPEVRRADTVRPDIRDVRPLPSSA